MSSVGLDIGGTYLKAAWLDDELIDVTRRPIPEFIDTAGRTREIDPNELIDSVMDLLDEVIGSRTCERILITGQMAGLAFVDEHGGALAPVISWQDTRINAIETVRNALDSQELQALGDGLRVGLPLVTLSELDAPRDSQVTSLIGFIAGALIEDFPPVIHATDAASLGLLDVAQCRWSDAALAVARLSDRQLPRPCTDVSVLGNSARFGSQVLTPVGDQQAALMGAGLASGEISMNIATGCQVSIVSDIAESPAQSRPYFDGSFLHTVTHLPAGRLLTKAVSEDLERAPTSEDWSAAVHFAEDPDTAVGGAIRTIAVACIDAAQRIDTGSRLVFSGGVAQKFPVLRDLIADQLAMPYRVYGGDDAALAGLRLLDMR